MFNVRTVATFPFELYGGVERCDARQSLARLPLHYGCRDIPACCAAAEINYLQNTKIGTNVRPQFISWYG